MRKAAAVAVVIAAALVIAFLFITGRSSPPQAPGNGAAPPAPSAPPARVPPGGPETIAIPAIRVHAAIRAVVSTHEQGNWLIVPPMSTNAELRRVYWWREHAAPAVPSKGTVYIYGHACTHYALCTFNNLHKLAPGDLVRITTTRGTLTYRAVTRPFRLAKTAAGIGASTIYDYGVRNRLILITCAYEPDGASPWNWVLITRLTAAATPRDRAGREASRHTSRNPGSLAGGPRTAPR